MLVFLGLSVRDRPTDVRRASSLNASALSGRGHNNRISVAPYGRNVGRRMIVTRSNCSRIVVVTTALEKRNFLCKQNKKCERPPQYAPAPCTLTFDLLTLKVAFESRVTWATSVPILVFLGLSVLDLGPMYATDRQTSDRCQTRVIA